MQLQQQVCTLEQAKKLKELGIKQEYPFANWYWYIGDTGNNVNHLNIMGSLTKLDDMCFSAFTVAELGLMLPEWTTGYPRYRLKQWRNEQIKITEWGICYEDWDTETDTIPARIPRWDLNAVFYPTEAQARAAMLIHLLENNLTTAAQVNDRAGK